MTVVTLEQFVHHLQREQWTATFRLGQVRLKKSAHVVFISHLRLRHDENYWKKLRVSQCHLCKMWTISYGPYHMVGVSLCYLSQSCRRCITRYPTITQSLALTILLSHKTFLGNSHYYKCRNTDVFYIDTFRNATKFCAAKGSTDALFGPV